MNKPYGSGYFGSWMEDEDGLPVFRYTCNQVTDPKAVTPTTTVWRAPNDHTFQLGNDRIVGLASNFGYIQVRQDEGAPKLLNDYLPEECSFGGGLGYLSSGEVLLSTYYDGQNPNFERDYGIGYFKKTVWNERLKAEQKLYAPYGDDPVIFSEVTITNLTDSESTADWFEYWGAQMYPLSYRAALLTINASDLSSLIGPEAAVIRRNLAKSFEHIYTSVDDGAGILEKKKFKGWTSEKAVWDAVKSQLRAASEMTGNKSYYCAELEQMEDIDPPAAFLYSLSGKSDGFITSAADFFGMGGPAHPDGLDKTGGLNASGNDTAMVIKKSVILKAKESKKLYFLYGYLPEGFTLDGLIEKYKANHESVFSSSCTEWKKGIGLDVKGKPWIAREMLWHNYYLRSSLSFDTYFQEHILSQGHLYQYIMGFQGAARDPLQHAMPFIYSEPWIVKDVIRYTLKEVLPDGEIPYGIVGHGCLMVSPILSSDFELWLLLLASEYVLATKDKAFLNEMIRPYPYKGIQQEPRTVLQMLDLCCGHFTNLTSEGSHGLSKLLHGDWNDNVVIGSAGQESLAAIWKEGESVLVAAMAAYVLERYSGMLEFAGEKRPAKAAAQKSEAQRRAVREQWNGKWFRRAYLSDELGWVGEDILWLEPQPWAILAGAASNEQKSGLIGNIDEMVRKPSPIGAMLQSGLLPQSKMDKGMVTNTGIWPSINGTLIWALTQADTEMAWDEWIKNSLARHADQYPDIWTGTWSASDVYNSVFSDHPGNTQFADKNSRHFTGLNWTDFPVLNLHPHAWPLFTAMKFAVDGFNADGVTLKPVLPESEYSLTSPLLGLARKGNCYRGWYAPLSEGSQRIRLILPKEEMNGRLTVLGKEHPFEKTEDAVVFDAPKGAEWQWEVG